MTWGIYLHVPFCAHVCPYCDFRKTGHFNGKDVDAYFRSIESQWNELYPAYSSLAKEVTFYWGGGTPSLFPMSRYEPLLARLQAAGLSIKEWTMEMNPVQVSRLKTLASDFKRLGGTRVTLGAQSLHDATLHYLGRKHTGEMVLKAIRCLREDLHFSDVQVDVMYGIKGHPLQKEMITKIVETGATGISAYALSIEQRTPFGQRQEQSALDELVAAEYELLRTTLHDLGLEQVETSNWVLKGRQTMHNNLYWQGAYYMGLGTGAHGLKPHGDFGQRYFIGPAAEKVREHVGKAGDDYLPFAEAEKEAMADLLAIHNEPERTHKEWQEEMILTALRTKEGISPTLARSLWGDDWYQQWAHLEQTDKLFISENKGVQVSDAEKIRGDFYTLLFLRDKK